VPPAPDAARLMRLTRMADALDSRWRIPGTGVRFGWDGVASVVPGVGDTVTAVFAGWMVLEAARMGAPAPLLARMAANVAVDWAVGSVPVLGTVFDVLFKANRRNLDLLTRHFAEGPPARRRRR
jgi:hypothetical protein